METEPIAKRGRGRPRKNPLPTIVAKSTIVRRTVSSDADGAGTEVLHTSLNFAGDNVVPIVRSASSAAIPEQSKEAAPAAVSAGQPIQDQPPKRRGRPPKVRQEENAAPVSTAPVIPETVTVSRDQLNEMLAVHTPLGVPVTPVISEGAKPAGFKGPGVRLGKEIQIGDSKLSFFYIVFKNSEHDELLYPDTMHSIQHLLSAAAKEADLRNIVKIMPCGSRIAMEVAVLDAHSDFSQNELRKLMLTAAYMDNIPPEELERCANPAYQNYPDAHREIREFIYTMYGITLDLKSADYSW